MNYSIEQSDSEEITPPTEIKSLTDTEIDSVSVRIIRFIALAASAIGLGYGALYVSRRLYHYLELASS